MNKELWHKIFKKYISDFDEIDKLQADKSIDDRETAILKNNLLVKIIKTFESEVNQ